LPDAALGSFGSPIVREVVLGADDRVKVSGDSMSRNPFRQICALRIRASTGAMFVGTGWFIGPNAIATAGHCVFLHREGGWPSSIDVIPAKFGTEEPFGQVRATKFRSVDGWIEDKGMAFDYGLILLEGSDLGERLGWFEVAAESTQELDESVANISGYPADRDQAAFQYFHARPLSGVTEELLEYDVDTYGGQSGSPVWVERDQITVVGIHTNGASSGNSGTRITEPVIDNFLTWMGGA
jgi:V8-like Glu-specific endopeptidase